MEIQSAVPAIVTRYTITSANDVPERDPKNWKLAGSNDGVNWAILDSQVNQSFASRFLTKTYTIDSNATLYTYYRLTITANEVNFNISNALNGLYFLHVTDGVEKAVRIIVKY
ncbi:hypothetical protein HB364_16315 [Pseudoflavitalea sp. X16]|uniref:hypothetical protein n=1 Tax=Paraflavitalea devenefica TaxID=2716334 RepID=UPI001421334E|nr:hypothetical protein [Paraflavitalea devenefica]NII26654.1 hypothetical protein [Paraflavitalea devenefica]